MLEINSLIKKDKLNKKGVGVFEKDLFAAAFLLRKLKKDVSIA